MTFKTPKPETFREKLRRMAKNGETSGRNIMHIENTKGQEGNRDKI